MALQFKNPPRLIRLSGDVDSASMADAAQLITRPNEWALVIERTQPVGVPHAFKSDKFKTVRRTRTRRGVRYFQVYAKYLGA